MGYGPTSTYIQYRTAQGNHSTFGTGECSGGVALCQWTDLPKLVSRGERKQSRMCPWGAWWFRTIVTFNNCDMAGMNALYINGGRWVHEASAIVAGEK